MLILRRYSRKTDFLSKIFESLFKPLSKQVMHNHT